MNVTAQTLVLIDNSLSVSKVNREITRLTLNYMFTHTSESRSYCFSTFSHDLDNVQTYTTDYKGLADMVSRLEYENKETSITDVVTKVLDEWQNSDFACRDIVIFTDGMEEKSVSYEKEELYYLLEHNSYPVYIICLDQENNKENVKNLSVICRLSGGKLFHTEFEGSDAEVERIVSEQLFKEMDNYSETNWSVYEKENDGEKTDINEAEKNVDNSEKSVDVPEQNKITEVINVENTPFYSNSNNYDNQGVVYEVSDEKLIGSPLSYAVSGVLVFTILIGFFLIFCIVVRHKRKLAREDDEYKKLIRSKLNEDRKNVENSVDNLRFSDNSIGQTVALVNRYVDLDTENETRLLYADLPTGEMTFEDANDPSKYFRIACHERIVLGRMQSRCDIAFEYDDSVSSRHCEIFARDNNWVVKDLESSNGTWINDEKVYTEKKLSSGDLLKLGSLILIVRF